MHLVAFAAVGLALGLTPAGKPEPPARLPSYEELAPAVANEGVTCAEHAQPVVRKTVLRGVHAGREYWGCSNAIPCGHFEWCDSPRLAGDGPQVERLSSPKSPPPSESLNGTVSRILYRGESGFTVARVRPLQVARDFATASDADAAVGTGQASQLGGRRESSRVASVGVRAASCLATARVGDEVRLGGRWTTHARYGRQFEALEALEVDKPQKSASVNAFASWLGSGIVPSVGPATANKVVAGLGARAEELLARYAAATATGARDDEADEALADAFGWKRDERSALAPQLVAKIADKVAEFAASRAVVVHLVELGVPLDAALALEREHKEKAWARFRDDPHGALMKAKGWGFRRSDAIALATPWSRPDAPLRARYGLVHALAETAASGHCARSPEQLLDLATHPLGPLATADFAPSRDALARALDSCIGSGQIRTLAADDRELLFTPWLDRAEETVARAVAARLSSSSSSSSGSDDDRDTSVPSALAAVSSLSPEQRAAVEGAARHPLFAICGGPGTGKTYSARGAVAAWRQKNPSAVVALAAPTARGAAALGAAIGERATTIHRLLEYSPRLGDFARNADQPLEVDAVVVDELSMLDVALAGRLLAAVPRKAKLLLVGDPDQLPSIGPGALLRDLLAVPALPRATLTQIFRVSTSPTEGFDASDIARDAFDVNRGVAPSRARGFLETKPGVVPDGSVFLSVDSAASARTAIVGAVDRLARAGFDPLADVQVLAPMKRGEAGVDALNRALQDLLNPTPWANSTVRPGDRVIQLANDYDVGVFNGDVGLVDVVMRNGSFVATFGLARVMYAPRDVGDSVALAYALTVHKAQGNEYPVVLVPLVAEHYQMLRRELLYTAVSRAKRLLVLVGNPRLLHHAVGRATADSAARTTGLAARIRGHLAHHARFYDRGDRTETAVATVSPLEDTFALHRPGPFETPEKQASPESSTSHIL